VRPIRFLREYSHYLTPRRGLLGADTWTIVSTWFRNTTLNQLTLVLFLAACLLLPRLAGLFAGSSTTWPVPAIWTACAVGLAGFGIVCWRTGTELARFVGHDRQRALGYEAEWAPASTTGLRRLQLTILAPGCVAGLLLAISLWRWALGGWSAPAWVGEVGTDGFAATSWDTPLLWLFRLEDPILKLGIGTAVLLAAGLLVTGLRAGYAQAMVRSAVGRPARVLNGLVVMLAVLLPAVAGGVMMAGVAWLFGSWVTPHSQAEAIRAMAGDADGGLPMLGWLSTALEEAAARLPDTRAGTWHVVTFGAPLVIEVFALSLVLHIGLIGRGLTDDRREWWTRLGAWVVIYSALWLALFVLAIYGPWLVARAVPAVGAWVAAMGGAAWVASTAWGAYAAQSVRTAPAGTDATDSRGWRDALAAAAPYVFVAGLLVLIALGMHLLVVRLQSGGEYWAALGWETLARDHWALLGTTTDISSLLLLLLAFAAAVAWLGYRIDVNEFSMHHFYKNRLVRCYLGASREADGAARRPHPFTGFDQADDLPVATLRTDPPATSDRAAQPYAGPFPIVNTTLNLVKGDDLAWQERKGQSFVFTPLFSGFEHVERPGTEAPPDLSDHGYRPTRRYGYADAGISLGTAIAISGAAASPNMGYHSSPAAGFLMTMFNVRLGWWLGNPRHARTWTMSSPLLGLTYLLNELLGNTTNSSRFVNLSDGGHFDNLGLYELVRRRCRLIVACDAEEDRRLAFGGLGSAIRKCRTDFGAEIHIDVSSIARKEGRRHWALGDIVYPGGECGLLLYLKSSLSGDEPGDVLEYSLRRKDCFPHESTADQFFDESQFESYRALGHHVVLKALEEVTAALAAPAAAARGASGTLARELATRLLVQEGVEAARA
jgi:hypothetical protein